MKLNNFDNQVKGLFEQRSLTPSHQSWDRLEAMLAQAEQAPSKKRSLRWLAYAASLTGIIISVFGGYLFLNHKPQPQEVIPYTSTTIPAVAPEKTPQQSSTPTPSAPQPRPMTTVSPSVAKQNAKLPSVTKTIVPQQCLSPIHDLAQDKSITREEVVVAIATPKQESISNTTPDVNYTLNIPKVTAFKPKLKVNKELLLAAADEDQETFRRRVFKALSNTSSHVVTYIQERNTAE